MPADCYMLGPKYDRRWDTVGSAAYARDLAAWPGLSGDDARHQSHFTLFCEIGAYLFGSRSREAVQFAMNRMARPEPSAPIPLDPQLILTLERAIARTDKNSSP